MFYTHYPAIYRCSDGWSLAYTVHILQMKRIPKVVELNGFYCTLKSSVWAKPAEGSNDDSTIFSFSLMCSYRIWFAFACERYGCTYYSSFITWRQRIFYAQKWNDHEIHTWTWIMAIIIIIRMEAVHAASGVYAYLLQFIAFVVCNTQREELKRVTSTVASKHDMDDRRLYRVLTSLCTIHTLLRALMYQQSDYVENELQNCDCVCLCGEC